MAIREAPRPLDSVQAASAVGLSPSTARTHLEVLCSAGLLRRLTEPRRSPGRPRVLYETADQPWSKIRQMGAVPRDAAEAGRRWAEVLSAPDGPAITPSVLAGVLTKVLEMLGLQPERGCGDAIVLRYCPFIELSRESLEAICGAHAVMLRTTAEHLGTQVDIEIGPVRGRDPGPCVLRLTTAGVGHGFGPGSGSTNSTRLM